MRRGDARCTLGGIPPQRLVRGGEGTGQHPAFARLGWDDLAVEFYLPDRGDIQAVASRAQLTNPHPDANGWLQAKIRQPPDDWDLRATYTVPGLVWTVESDTCGTGPPVAPRNVAFDAHYREFVYRQPVDEDELVAVMSADSEEVHSCYRFDGLERWTVPSLDAWCNFTHELVVGWLRYELATQTEDDPVEGWSDACDYLTSAEFREYVGRLREVLAAKPAHVR